jgi:hypothetical protein
MQDAMQSLCHRAMSAATVADCIALLHCDQRFMLGCTHARA